MAAALAVAKGWRDADGFVDCWPHCSGLQRGVGGALFYGAILVGVLSVATIAALIRRALRGSVTRTE